MVRTFEQGTILALLNYSSNTTPVGNAWKNMSLLLI